MMTRTPRQSTFVAPAPLCDNVGAFDKIQIPSIEFPTGFPEDTKPSDANKPRRRRPRRASVGACNGVAKGAAGGDPSSAIKRGQKPRTTSVLSSRTESTVSTCSLASTLSFDSVMSKSTIESPQRSLSPQISMTRRSRPKVWFGCVQVNEHLYTLGDNPSVSDGTPITISWRSQQKTIYEVEYYETYHPSEQRRRAKTGLKLSADDRCRLLLSAGYSMAEVVACGLDIQRQRKKREESVRNKKWDGIHEKIENTTRKLRKVASRRRSLLASSDMMPRNGGKVDGGRLGSSMSSIQLESPRKKKKKNKKSKAAKHKEAATMLERMNASAPQLDWARVE